MAPASKAEGSARGRAAAKAEAAANDATHGEANAKDAGQNDANLGLVSAQHRISRHPPTLAFFQARTPRRSFFAGVRRRTPSIAPERRPDRAHSTRQHRMTSRLHRLTDAQPHFAIVRARRMRFSQPRPRSFAARPGALTGARTRRRRATRPARRAIRVPVASTAGARTRRDVNPVATPARATRPASPAPGKIRTPRSRPARIRTRTRRRRRSSSRRTASPSSRGPRERARARDAPARRPSSATTTTTT